MDSVEIEPFLPKKWPMKNLVWQQNCHQKVFYREALQYI